MKRFISDPFSTNTPSDYPTKEMKELFGAIVSLKTIEEAGKFFRDLLTIAELTECANRWQMVKLLIAGNSYATIARKLNTSTTTVTRVAYWLKQGFGGYREIADRVLPAKQSKSHGPSFRLRGKYTLVPKI